MLPRAVLNNLARVHYGNIVANFRHYAKVVRYHYHRGLILRLQLFHQLQHLRLNGNVKRGSRLVRYKEARVARQRHCNYHALLHAAGKLVRIIAAALRPYANKLQHVARFPVRLGTAAAVMQAYNLSYLVRNRHNGVKARHGVLEYHGNFLAAYFAHFLFAYLQKVLPVEEYFARYYPCRGSWKYAHYGLYGRCFARARFAHKAQRFAVAKREIKVFHGVHRGVIGLIVNSKVLYFQKLFVRHCVSLLSPSASGQAHRADRRPQS